MSRLDAKAFATPFVGRAAELAEIGSRLADPECRLLTLTGLGGSGKTRLALAAAQAAEPHFAGGSMFVGLQSLFSGALVVAAVAQAAGLTFYGEADPETQLLNYLREKSLLIVFDNFEHVLDAAGLVSRILAAAPGVKALVTSREALNLREEWLYPVKGLTRPPSVYSSPHAYDAVELFLHHARRVSPGFDPAAEHDAVVRICNMTAGLPLAIELAASWLKGLGASQIAHEMQHNLDFLTSPARNIEERHRSMRAVFDQSWSLLADVERRIFAQLSVFRASFDGDAARAVANASLSQLAGLVEKSLIQSDASGRFSIHELLRQYGVEKLAETGETDGAAARHSEHFAARMQRHEAAIKRPEQMDAIRAIEADFENVRSAWEWALAAGRFDLVDTMLNGLYLFGFVRSRYRETILMFEHALADGDGDDRLRGRLLARRWGYLHWWYQSDYAEAAAAIERALHIAETANDSFEIAFCRLMTAYTLISTQRYADAIPHLEQSRALFESLGEAYYVCWVLHRLGYVHANLNESAISQRYTEQSLALARPARNRLALVICLYNLGSDYLLQGDYAKGREFCTEALHVAEETGHQGQVAHALSLIALGAFAEGDYDTCRAYAERSRAIVDEINLLAFQPYNLALLVVLACLDEAYADAARMGELSERSSTNTMGRQLHLWAQSVFACSVGNEADARLHIRSQIDLSGADAGAGPILLIVPCAACIVAASDPGMAVQLLAWCRSYPAAGFDWIGRWSAIRRLSAGLQESLDAGSYQAHTVAGESLSYDEVASYLRREFAASDHAVEPPSDQRLTTREREILRLMADGLTNPQIAERLVIGSGTVKTHTLNIYRKLEVANRTQAIACGRRLGLLPA